MHTSPELAIETSGLRKLFGATAAVDGLDLAVRRGTVHGFLGPNGAGKTTTLRILATLLRPDHGAATVLGHDVVREPDAVRRRVSLTGQFATIDGDLTGAENLVLLGRLLGHRRGRAKSRASELLVAFGLADAANRQAKTYSGGMRRRLDLAASLVTTPDLLFLDEPTTGLDPRSRQQVWATIRAVVAAGATVLLTTQYLDEADQLADRITVIDRGAIIAEGSSGELKASTGSNTLHVRLADPDQRQAAEQLLTRALDTQVRRPADAVALSARIPAGADAGRRATAALSALDAAGVAVREFDLAQPSLDDVFLALTGRIAERSTNPAEDAR